MLKGAKSKKKKRVKSTVSFSLTYGNVVLCVYDSICDIFVFPLTLRI